MNHKKLTLLTLFQMALLTSTTGTKTERVFSSSGLWVTNNFFFFCFWRLFNSFLKYNTDQFQEWLKILFIRQFFSSDFETKTAAPQQHLLWNRFKPNSLFISNISNKKMFKFLSQNKKNHFLLLFSSCFIAPGCSLVSERQLVWAVVWRLSYLCAGIYFWGMGCSPSVRAPGHSPGRGLESSCFPVRRGLCPRRLWSQSSPLARGSTRRRCWTSNRRCHPWRQGSLLSRSKTVLGWK